MTTITETAADATLTDPSPKRKPGRPKGSKDKRPRKNARRAAQRAARSRSGQKEPARPDNRGVQVNARWPKDALARIDAFGEAIAADSRGEAVREAALSWIARWERLQRQEAPAPAHEAPAGFLGRLWLAWRILRGSAKVRVL